MAKSKALEGKDVMLFIDGKTIALATSCSLNVTRGSTDSSSKDDGVWETDVPGNMSWTANGDSLFAPKEGLDEAQIAYDGLFKAMSDGKDVEFIFGQVSNPDKNGLPDSGGWLPPSTNGYVGKAHVTELGWSNPKGSSSTMTASFKGNGPLRPQSEVAESSQENVQTDKGAES